MLRSSPSNPLPHTVIFNGTRQLHSSSARSSLSYPLLGFLRPHDPRVLSSSADACPPPLVHHHRPPILFPPPSARPFSLRPHEPRASDFLFSVPFLGLFSFFMHMYLHHSWILVAIPRWFPYPCPRPGASCCHPKPPSIPLSHPPRLPSYTISPHPPSSNQPETPGKKKTLFYMSYIHVYFLPLSNVGLLPLTFLFVSCCNNDLCGTRLHTYFVTKLSS